MAEDKPKTETKPNPQVMNKKRLKKIAREKAKAKEAQSNWPN